MKLVQLLAKELKEWPEGVTNLTQSEVDYEIYDGLDGNKEDSAEPLDEQFYASRSHSEGPYPMVTRDQWQAEREKMNKPKWIRYRGGNRCVDDDVFVEVKLRCGDVQRGEAKDFIWSHHCCDSAANIMAYRVIEEEKDQEIEEVKKTNLGTITYKLEIDATEATKEIDSLVAKWGQIESPLKWRDAIIHCQAIIEDCEREIERNVNLLDAEGLMMQKDSKKAMQHYAPDVDMSDWRNWKAGDIVECINQKGWVDISEGSQYVLNNKDFFSFVDDDGENRSFSLVEMNQENVGSDFKFIRRP